MQKEIISGVIGTSISAIGTATQTSEVLQIISLVITIVGGLITFIIVPLISWFNKAKEDGKITKEELKDGCDIVIKGGEQIKDDLDRKDK